MGGESEILVRFASLRVHSPTRPLTTLPRSRLGLPQSCWPCALASRLGIDWPASEIAPNLLYMAPGLAGKSLWPPRRSLWLLLFRRSRRDVNVCAYIRARLLPCSTRHVCHRLQAHRQSRGIVATRSIPGLSPAISRVSLLTSDRVLACIITSSMQESAGVTGSFRRFPVYKVVMLRALGRGLLRSASAVAMGVCVWEKVS